MYVPVNQPTLAGAIEWLVGDTKPDLGVELSVSYSVGPDMDVTGYLTVAQAELLIMALQQAMRRVRMEQERVRGIKAPLDIMEFIGE